MSVDFQVVDLDIYFFTYSVVFLLFMNFRAKLVEANFIRVGLFFWAQFPSLFEDSLRKIRYIASEHDDSRFEIKLLMFILKDNLQL